MPRPWTPADVAALRELTAAGLKDIAIGRRLGRPAKGVAAKRERLGLRKHGRTRLRVLRLAAAGYSTGEIADLVGRSDSLVRMVRAAGRAG